MYYKSWRAGITRPSLFLFFSEVLLIHLSVFLSIYLRFSGEYTKVHFPILNIFIISFSLSLALYYVQAYSSYLYIEISKLVLLTVILQGIVLSYVGLAVFYYIFSWLYVGRGILLINLVIVSTFLFIWRAVFPWISPKMGLTRKAVILGDNSISREIERILFKRENTGFEIVKILSLTDKPETKEIMDFLKENSIKTVFVTTSSLERLPFEFLWQFQLQGFQLIEGVSFHEWLTGKVTKDNLTSKNFLFFYNPGNSFLFRTTKQCMDIALSLLLIFITLPLQIIIAIIIKLTSRGPIFYDQTRTGYYDKPFVIYKYRTMVVDAEDKSGPQWAKHRDPRITRIGRFLRLTRFDELPQVFNVLKGEMSVIGPRPERPIFTEMFKEKIPFYHLRHSVRPGITGWAQVQYEYTDSLEATDIKLQYDLYYIKNFSLTLDFIIILKTVKTLITGQGAK